MADTVINQPRNPNDFYEPPFTDVLQIMTERKQLKKWLYGEYVRYRNQQAFCLGAILGKLSYKRYFELTHEYSIDSADANNFLLKINLYVYCGDDTRHFNEQNIQDALLAFRRHTSKAPPSKILQLIERQLNIPPATQKELDKKYINACFGMLEISDVDEETEIQAQYPELIGKWVPIENALAAYDEYYKRYIARHGGYVRRKLTLFDFTEPTKLKFIKRDNRLFVDAISLQVLFEVLDSE